MVEKNGANKSKTEIEGGRKLKNYIVAISDIFEYKIELKKVTAKDKVEAILKATESVEENEELYQHLLKMTLEEIIQWNNDSEILVSEPLEVKEF